jgi:hypothetical protein
MHQIRLTNKSQYPLTTAPALIVRDGRLLGQGMMTYTAIGSTSDLEITAAVDIQVAKSDTETGRQPNAEKWNGDTYSRIDFGGVVSLCNHRSQPVEIEVTRYVLGQPGAADHDAKVERVNAFEDGGFIGVPRGGFGRPHSWWYWYNWPHWWHRFNGAAKFSWTLKLDPGQSVDLKYEWYYYWR